MITFLNVYIECKEFHKNFSKISKSGRYSIPYNSINEIISDKRRLILLDSKGPKSIVTAC